MEALNRRGKAPISPGIESDPADRVRADMHTSVCDQLRLKRWLGTWTPYGSPFSAPRSLDFIGCLMAVRKGRHEGPWQPSGLRRPSSSWPPCGPRPSIGCSLSDPSSATPRSELKILHLLDTASRKRYFGHNVIQEATAALVGLQERRLSATRPGSETDTPPFFLINVRSSSM